MKKSLYYGAAAAALCVGGFAGVALAQQVVSAPNILTGDILIPTGTWFDAIWDPAVKLISLGSGMLLTWIGNKYLHGLLNKTNSDYIVGLETDALNAAKNRLQAEVPGQVVIPTQNVLLSTAANWIIETEPQLVSWFGGKAGIMAWLESKISVVPITDGSVSATIAATAIAAAGASAPKA